MKTELFEVVLRLCGADDAQEWMRLPREIAIDGRSGAFVTHGRALLVVWGEPAADPGTEPPMPAKLTEYLEEMLAGNSPHTDIVPLRELTDWVGEGGCAKCRGSLRVRCPECYGAGKVAHDCECPHCQFTGSEMCEACQGDKMIGCECDEIETSMVFGQCFDRRILREALPRLDEPVSVDWTGSDIKPLRIRGDGWTVVAMGMRSPQVDKPFPTFSATERTVVA